MRSPVSLLWNFRSAASSRRPVGSSSNDIDLGRQEQTEMASSIGSLERNVSSLMNNLISSLRFSQSPSRPSRPLFTYISQQQRCTSSTSVPSTAHPPSTQQNSDNDRFVPPATAVSGEHLSRGYKGLLSLLPPNEKDEIMVYRAKKIGEGSSSKVFSALGHSTRQLYALKWIQIRRDDDREHILNEISLMKSLTDDNVIALLDHQEDEYSIYVIMEYGDTNLKQLIKRQHEKRIWDINFIRYYCSQMLQVVRVIHEEDIVHSNLKPAKFVVVKGRLKLTDLDIIAEKSVSDDTTNIQRDIQIGTINYMAPEVFEPLKDKDLEKYGRCMEAQRDVWSLGCILYQMIYEASPLHHLPSLPQKLHSITNPNYKITFPTEASYGDSPLQKYHVSALIIESLKSCFERDPVIRASVAELRRHRFVYITN